MSSHRALRNLAAILLVQLVTAAPIGSSSQLHLCCKQVTGFKDRLRRATLSTGTHAANTPQPHRASHPQAQKASPPLGSARVTRTGTLPFESWPVHANDLLRSLRTGGPTAHRPV